MQIVANSLLLKIFSKIDLFKMDLGRNLTGAYSPNKELKIKILDEFIKKYQSITGKYIHNYGNIENKIIFYHDPALKEDELIIFKDDKIYELNVNLNDIEKPREYLSNILFNLEGNTNESNNDNIEKKVVYTNMPEDELDYPSMSLELNEYVHELTELHKKRNPIDENDEELKYLIEKKKRELAEWKASGKKITK